ncbi:MAG: hypothetical protein MJB14_10225 [Spirochaetes bacterium]|nr:hypothetical protein [Spirochaetota bacterium]
MTFEIATEPEADAEDDNSYQGIYKGVLSKWGFSGTYKVKIGNTSHGEKIEYIMITSGKKYTLKGTEIAKSKAYSRYIYTFESSIQNMDFEFHLAVEYDGTIYTTECYLDAERIPAVTFKETSTELVMCFEGSADDNNDSTLEAAWNMIIKGSEVWGTWAWNKERGLGLVSGIYDSSKQVFDIDSAYNVYGNLLANISDTGVLKDHSFSGDWITPASNGSWQGKRSL